MIQLNEKHAGVVTLTMEVDFEKWFRALRPRLGVKWMRLVGRRAMLGSNCAMSQGCYPRKEFGDCQMGVQWKRMPSPTLLIQPRGSEEWGESGKKNDADSDKTDKMVPCGRG